MPVWPEGDLRRLPPLGAAEHRSEDSATAQTFVVLLKLSKTFLPQGDGRNRAEVAQVADEDFERGLNLSIEAISVEHDLQD